MSKRLHEYTDQELAKIYQAGSLNTLMDLESAHRGIQLLPELPEEPKAIKVEKLAKAFCLGSIKFRSYEDAATIMCMLGSMELLKEERCPGGGYSSNYLTVMTTEDYYYPKITTESYFNLEDWNSNKTALLQYEQAKDIYDAAKKSYDEIQKQRQEIEEEALARISDYNDKQQRLCNAIILRARYESLAEGNSSIAQNFFRNAQPSLFEEFQAELWPRPEIAADSKECREN